jgi:hypothetical protein
MPQRGAILLCTDRNAVRAEEDLVYGIGLGRLTQGSLPPKVSRLRIDDGWQATLGCTS